MMDKHSKAVEYHAALKGKEILTYPYISLLSHEKLY